MIIYHLAFANEWDAAQTAGEYRMSTRGMTLEEVGFIHGSFEEQVAVVAANFYADVEEALVVLVIDTDLVDAEVKVDDVGKEQFPHIYGPLPTRAVVEVRPFAQPSK